jgi:hypothetical protein
MLLKYRLHRFTPKSTSIRQWWSRLIVVVHRRHRKEISALIILVSCLWLERNSTVFNRFAIMHAEVCRKISIEFNLQAMWKVRRDRVDLPSRVKFARSFVVMANRVAIKNPISILS